MIVHIAYHGCIKISRIEMHSIKANSQLKFLIYSRRSEKTKLHIVFCTKFAHLHVFIIIGLHSYGNGFFSHFFYRSVVGFVFL